MNTITHSQVGQFELHKKKFLDEKQQHILNDSRIDFKQDYKSLFNNREINTNYVGKGPIIFDVF